MKKPKLSTLLLLIIVFIITLFLLGIGFVSYKKHICATYEENFLTHVKNIYDGFKPTRYGVHYDILSNTCVGYASGITNPEEESYIDQNHVQYIRDISRGKDIYSCTRSNTSDKCLDSAYLSHLNKYGIK